MRVLLSAVSLLALVGCVELFGVDDYRSGLTGAGGSGAAGGRGGDATGGGGNDSSGGGPASGGSGGIAPQPGEVLWTQVFSGGSDAMNLPRVDDVAISTDGVVVLTARVGAATTFAPGVEVAAAGYFILRLDLETGHVETVYDILGEVDNLDVVSGPDGAIFVAGGFDDSLTLGAFTVTSNNVSDVLVARLDGPDFVWADAFGGSGDVDNARVGVVGDRVIIQHEFSGSSLGEDSAGERDVGVASYNFAGERQWYTAFGGTNDEYPQGIASVGDNLALLFTQQASFNFGSCASPGGSTPDQHLFLLTPAGACTSGRGWGDPTMRMKARVYSALDGLYVAGESDAAIGLVGVQSAGGRDIYHARLGASLNTIWSSSVPALGDQFFADAAFGPRGAIMVGSTEAPVDFGSGVVDTGTLFAGWVAAYDQDGMPSWDRRASGADDLSRATVELVAVSADGSVAVVVGRFEEAADLFGEPVTGVAPINIYLAAIQL